MSRKKDGDKIKLAEAKYITGESPEKIAAALGVSRRTIDRWADDGNWAMHRENNKQSNNVIQLKPLPKTQTPKPEFRQRDIRGLDDLAVIESAIADIDASLPEAGAYKGGMAGALVKLIELKRKLKPETVLDLVERAIELGVGPEEFLAELKNAWQRRA